MMLLLSWQILNFISCVQTALFVLGKSTVGFKTKIRKITRTSRSPQGHNSCLFRKEKSIEALNKIQSLMEI
jgi:hypothetical protein